MSTKKQSIIIIAIVLLVGLIITGSSYAFWMWSSNTSKNVIFNTSSDLKKYIVYDEGNSKFTGNFEATNSYNQGMHSTISIYKKAEAANTDLFATIHMNINEIGTNMRQSQALKWIVTSGTSANIGSVLASGNFVGVNNGDNLDLVTNLEVTTTETFYTIWIWLDASLNPSNLLTGETLDTNVWTEIMQLEGAENRYEITRVTANHQTINASVVDTQYKITNYAVTNSNVTPSVWTSIPSNDQNYIYNMPPYNVNEIGTYHVWFKDSANRTISKSVEVTDIDNTPATTEYTAIFYYQSDGTNGSTTVTSTTASCTASSGSSCNVNIPTAVKNSVGTYNNTYAGLANTTGTMSTSSGANSSAPTVTLSANTTYYAVYSTEVTIRIPDDTSTCSTDTYYRNQWFTSTSAMASTVLATSATGTNEPIFDSSINDGLETYNLYGYGTTANSTTKTYNDFAAIKNSNSTSVYGIMYTQRSVQFYYSNSSTGSKTNSTVSGNRYIVCTHDTTANYSNASVTAPGTTAPYGTSLIGWATSANSMTTATVNTANTTYYAIYRGNVTNYYYSGSAYTSRTLYRNGTYGSETNYTMYLSTANNDLSNYETATGPGSSEWAGLSTAADTTPEYSTVTEAATSSSASLYTVYRMYALFHTGENVSSIGANGDTCKVSATGASSGGTSCTIILPSIESNDGYISVGWSLTSGDITGTVTGNNYTLNSAVVNLYANATDPLPPTGTISTTVSSNTVTATVTVIDNGSGPAESYGWKISTDATCDGNTTGFVDSTSDNYSFNVTNPGIHYICVRIEDNAGNYGYLIKPAKTSHIDYVYTGNYQTFTAPADGYYYIKTRGAQGGNGANGGESSGYIYLNENDNLYVYVGEQGHANNTQTNTGGWNGGGASGSHADAKSYGGGGATDIRLVAGDWNNATSLNSRIMVAGGGGGGFAHNTTTYTITPGNGGGLIGLNGTGSMTGSDIIDPAGGSQTTGGAFGRTTGSGGVGAFGYAAQSNSSGYGGGGGGGYYGGGNGYGRGGAAGSSFISGYAGSNAITSASSTTPSENTKHYSGKYFVVGEMTAGTNTGNGSVRIEFVGDLPERKNTKLSNVRYVKDCVAGSTVSKYIQWVEMQVIKNGMNIASGITPSVSATQAPSDNDYNREYSNITDGRVDNNAWGEPAEYGLQCATIDLGSAQSVDEIAVWHLNKGGREFLNDVLLVSIDGTNWTPIAGHEGVETSIGLRVNAWTDKEVDLQELIQVEYPYSGEYRAFTVPVNGYYYAETNGAKGGSGANGGYASGVIHLNAGEKLYVYTGGTGGTSNSAVNAGGWNGGGTAGNTSTTYGYGGGGATDIRIVNGAWDNATSLESRIMVAGGGGGTYQVTGSHSGYGGAGGGLLGSVGGGSFSNSNTTTDATVSGATQREGGHTNYGAANSYDGVFGYANQTTKSAFGGGGGGGYYGGATGYGKGGSGGSSFISGFAGSNAITAVNNRTATNDTLHYSGKYFIDGGMNIGVRNGTGLANIRYIDEPVRINSAMQNVRYVKDCINGNTVNAYDQWIEIQVIKDGVNIAKGKTVGPDSGSAPYVGNSITTAYSYVTDGMIDNFDTYQGYARTTDNGLQCLTIDLGEVYDYIDEIAVWHYFGNATRTYNDNVTYVSSTNSSDIDDWDVVLDHTEMETSVGKHITAWTVDIVSQDAANPTSTLTTTSNLKSASQTATITCSDDTGITGYYWGTTQPNSTGSNVTYTAVPSTTTYNTTVSVTSAGTYYLSCRDGALNISTNTSKTYYTYKVNNMLETATGTEGTYTTSNYSQASSNTYLAPSGTTLTLSSIYTRPNYSSAGRFAGVSTGAAGSSSASVSSTAPTLSSNSTYSMWWNRNRIIFRYKPNGGTITASTTTDGGVTYYWGTDSSTGYITRGTTSSNKSPISTTLRYGATSLDLYNYNNTKALNITKSGQKGKDNEQWICESGCKTSGQTFSHSAITVTSTNICNDSTLKTGECTVVIKVNWVSATTYTCKHLTYGTSGQGCSYCYNTLGGTYCDGGCWLFNQTSCPYGWGVA